MKDGAVIGCIGLAAIVACYGLYLWRHPTADGVIFASILAAVASMVTAVIAYSVAVLKAPPTG